MLNQSTTAGGQKQEARVPGSFNSKLAELNEKGEIVNIPESAEVKIMQEGNGIRHILFKEAWNPEVAIGIAGYVERS